MEIKDNEKRIKEKVDFFMNKKIGVHVELIDKTFMNGFVEKQLQEGVYWFIDRKFGGVYLFLKDIYDIDKYNEVKNEKETKV